MAVAEEAALTAEFYGNQLCASTMWSSWITPATGTGDELRTAKVLIVVAGMEGALPNVVGGLVDKPVAVPTGLGYGAALTVLPRC